MPVFQLQDRQGESLSDIAKTAISRAKTSWLKNTEVVDLLINHQKYHLPVSSDPPNKPAGERPLFAPTKGLKEVDRINLPWGTLYLFDKKQERYFRRDGHHWRKKANGKTVRETHEKLKVDNKDTLNCYYTHSEKADALQRRCYWLLDQDDGIVLVHYLTGSHSRNRHAGGPGGQYKQDAEASPGHEAAQNDEADQRQMSDGAVATGSEDRAPYGRALHAKRLNGDVIQPTAVHASSFAYAPLFRAIDEKFQQERLQHMAASSRQRQDEERTADAGRRHSPPPFESRAEDGEGVRASYAANGARQGDVQHRRPEEPSPSPSRGHADPNSDLETAEPSTKRHKRSAADRSQEDLLHEILGASREMAAHFRQSTEALLQHIQAQRQADEQYRQDLLNFERERAKSERENLTAIATSILGHISALSRSTHNNDQASESINLGRYSTPAASIPLGAFAHGVALSGLGWPQHHQDQGR